MKATVKYMSNESEKTLELNDFKSLTKYSNGLVEIKNSEENVETTIRLQEEFLISVDITK